MKVNHIYQGDALEVLQSLESQQVDMCVTSPPYWRLRDYGVDGQLGLESTFTEYINKLCNIFDEVKRVLKDNGTCWVNISDTYGGNQNRNSRRLSANHPKDCDCSYCNLKRPDQKCDIKSKSLIGIPFRFAIEMINRGWILRNTIIWHKPNCMPSSVKDRFTVDFEYLYFFSKKPKYYFEQQLEKSAGDWTKKGGAILNDTGWHKGAYKSKPTIKDLDKLDGLKRNKRTVWTISTKPYKGAHFAVFPEELIETPIKAGCPVNGVVLDPFMGSGTTASVAKRLNRNYVGIELNPEYHGLIHERLDKTARIKPLSEYELK